MTIGTYQLRDLMNEMDENKLSSLLNSFECTRNKDSENFLKNASKRHDKKDISRTYVMVDFDKNKVFGYYTLAMKCLNVSDIDPNLGEEFIRSMNLNDGTAQAFLLGQLARSDEAEKGSGKMMLDHALVILTRIKEKIGCRMVRLDCRDDLIRYYETQGFRRIRKNNEKDLNQMVRFI
ncbi:MAG: hypothetical protein FWD37_02575 [Methanomassiliicoccaceae archaeon]|nr:hypothetical protein [Methanomassiliicoccaceae archaeon]